MIKQATSGGVVAERKKREKGGEGRRRRRGTGSEKERGRMMLMGMGMEEKRGWEKGKRSWDMKGWEEEE